MPKRTYEECKHIKRTTPEQVADANLAREIGQNYRTLPTFEKVLYERLYIKHYSIHRNELLKCRWAIYKDNLTEKEPFQFPDIRHLHFKNGAIRYLPSETISDRTDHKMKLRPGPGVDTFGQIPVPNELLLFRNTEKTGRRSIRSAKKIVKRK